ncbi:TPA: nucleoside monophosphate kinase [Candidatus Berkelbacteria bacterium]|uniref:Adenylate kinase n=1 Tax=Berkelbacteria bacterium GW2011_GWE1_39_12 TaxID=1618337 RepID=A0A0G4B6Z5_9BACT|nr:MAG: nucleoside-triphosphate--adenylate kinase, adenylate kinase [Berkelbacteria bacterium GW2011_GWE1_39_12]HBO60178.1 nucleoside monophosphate kinase [Candidatus Berkelbacteria bacterium]
MQSFIFLGPPASGKGTQAKDLAEKLGLIYFGTGDFMRAEAKKQSHFGQIFQRVWDEGKGNLVDDDIVLEFVKAKIEEIGQEKGFVFDGFPRTIKQAEFLNQELKHNLTVFNIEVSEDSIVSRSGTRKVCENCGKIFFKAPVDKRNCEVCGGGLIHRQEDTPGVVKKRLEVYNLQTKPLIDHYKSNNALVEIDGEPNIEEVALEIEEKVNERRSNN